MKHLIGLAGRSLAVLGLVFSLSGRSDAASISAISSTGTGFALTSSSFNNDVDPTSALNTITLNMTANTIGSVFNVRFELLKDVPSAVTRSYVVTMNLTNNVGRQIPGFDVETGLGGGGGYSSSIEVTPLPTPGVFALENILPGQTNLTNGWRFGGLSGGGSVLNNGGVTTVVFSYSTTNSSGAAISGTRFSSLNFTANPEPTTLLLGSLAMIPAAVVARRRRKAALELIEA